MTPFNATKALDESQVWQIKNQKEKFKLVFLADISTLPAYLVPRKGNHEVEYLIRNGAGLFPSTYQRKLQKPNKTLWKWASASPSSDTACGFHTFRVVESVARRYWDAVAGGKPRPTSA